MAGLTEHELHHKILDKLREGEDPKPFVIEWCTPQCTSAKETLSRCERGLKIIKAADPEKTCLFRYRQWVECVENCVQPRIWHNLKGVDVGQLNWLFEGAFAMRWLFLPLWPLSRIFLGMKRVQMIEGDPLE
mmetsp:Transcript_17229/g.31009  ORF Transcript_17229/g.31009 Transcript_17229/m.31009 type:complete len:132 (+) Transcript_17229:14731-15126(+)